MENIELRKSIAIILGCKAVIRKPYVGHNLYVFCECKDRLNSHSWPQNGKHLVKPYELDHHAAIDALMEFCEKREFEWNMSKRFNFRRQAYYYADVFANGYVYEGVDTNQAVAICKAITKASQSEKKEAGEG